MVRANAVQDTSGSQSGLLRVLKLSDEVRDSSFSSISKILETLKLYLIGNDEENVWSGLKALDSLARTMAPEEVNALILAKALGRKCLWNELFQTLACESVAIIAGISPPYNQCEMSFRSGNKVEVRIT